MRLKTCFFDDRLVSERSIEENILKKANQKRLLGDLAIEGGNFTTAFFKKSTIKDLFDVNSKTESSNVPTETITEISSENTEGKSDRKAVKAFEKAIASVEDNTDLEVKNFHIQSFFHEFFADYFIYFAGFEKGIGRGCRGRG